MLESPTLFLMLCIASFFTFLYEMDRKSRREQTAADAKGDTSEPSA